MLKFCIMKNSLSSRIEEYEEYFFEITNPELWGSDKFNFKAHMRQLFPEYAQLEKEITRELDAILKSHSLEEIKRDNELSNDFIRLLSMLCFRKKNKVNSYERIGLDPTLQLSQVPLKSIVEAVNQLCQQTSGFSMVEMIFSISCKIVHFQNQFAIEHALGLGEVKYNRMKKVLRSKVDLLNTRRKIKRHKSQGISDKNIQGVESILYTSLGEFGMDTGKKLYNRNNKGEYNLSVLARSLVSFLSLDPEISKIEKRELYLALFPLFKVIYPQHELLDRERFEVEENSYDYNYETYKIAKVKTILGD